MAPNTDAGKPKNDTRRDGLTPPSETLKYFKLD
jgi:hypothetical protein